ncbi:hypothetical protein EPR50_G00093320 [Perca flavescens]|uniref:Laminin subunit beta-4 n=1 Tax=Perca flavescens TaxID=8167 RepID=A0A484D3W4_PERFV|nr:hypothetical protein EPR50_G00093320 [Perca flavescens]
MIFIFFTVFLPAALFHDPGDIRDLQDQCPDGSCDPQLGDLMVGRAAQLSASSTCGLDGPENYCIIGYLEEERKCFICDSRLPFNLYSNPNSHRIENIITTFDPERRMKWWQSENGVHEVSIQLDLETMFQFSHLVLNFKSFRPAAMLVERSKDFGRSWKVFRYFAEDCLLHFPSVSDQPADSVDDVVCDSRYSSSDPSTDGEVVLKALDPVFEIENLYAPHIQGCNCHGHSDSCHFDSARFKATGSVSGGICDDCRHDRTGPQCERCQPFLYQDPQRTTDDPHACIPCDCDPAGSQGGGLCDALSGHCVCKENVEGQRCDRCKHGFFNLRQDNPSGCQVCRCHVLGSVGSCDQLTGSCECDHLAIGPLCDRCLEGFWGLGNSVFRCSPCDCDVGGAYSTMCSPEDGQCQCLPNMVGRRCSDPAPAYFLPLLDYFLYEAELAAPLHGGSSPPSTPPSSSSSPLVNPGVLPRCEKYFREQGYDFKFTNGRVILVRKTPRLTRRRRQQRGLPLEPGHALQIVPRQRTADRPVTWTGLGFVRVLEGAGLRFTVDNLPSSMDYQLVIRYEPESPSDWLASVSIIAVSLGDGRCSSDPTGSKTLILPGNSRGSILDSAVCLNAGGQYFVNVVFNKQPGSDASSSSHLLIDSMDLIPSIESVRDFCSQSDLDSFRHFRCIGLAAELGQPESLLGVCEGLIKSMSARIHNGAVPCECDPRGLLSELCDQVRGQCVCRLEVTGQRCDRCLAGFWGFPFCRPCECNGLSEVCDEETGECLNCREQAIGPNCDRCVEGYYGNPVSRTPCQPCLCPDAQSSGRFFATSCQHDPQSLSVTCDCREGHTGPSCDRCIPGFYGDLSLPGAQCEECPCNNNISPDDRDPCNSLTGECLQCLHNTTGPRCQDCKPGYYGNALDQDCNECLCDRRGTEVTQCPLESPCFCDSRTGQCPCRTGVLSVLCDECEDGYWNLGRASGCQPCSCDPVNSFSNICNKVTGQCPCRPEFGGRQCDECGENHFGNPDLQCISCDCNLEGTERPSCDPETGECLCRVGITGIFCDQCAPGYDSAFPACAECHSCTGLWAESMTDVHRAAQRMKTFITSHGDDLRPRDGCQLQQMLEMKSKLDGLANLTRLSPPNLEKLEKLFAMIGKVKDGIDPNMILIDLSPLLNTDIDNIRLEFKTLLNNLKRKLIEDPDDEEEHIEELLDEIQKRHNAFMLDEKRVRNASRALEDSMDTRQEVKHKLSMCSSSGSGDLALLEKNVKELSVVNLNRKLCGGPGLDDCSGCGGALCGSLHLGNRKCGGPNCDGVVPIKDAQRAAQDTKDRAKDLQDRINDSMVSLEREKNQTKQLIQRVKDYLMDEMVPPEDIEKMSQAVLAIQLPGTPDQIRSMIKDINNLLSNTINIQDDLRYLQETAETAQDLLQRARELKERTKNIDVTEISRDISGAEKAQDKANNDLDAASRDRDMTKDRIQDMKDKLDDVETKLMNRQPKNLQDEIEALKEKTEQNKEMARDAQEAADSALNQTTDTEPELEDVMKLFELLKQKTSNQTVQSEAGERLKNIVEEAEKMKKQVEDKLQQIQDLEQKIQKLIQNKEIKAAEVSMLLDTVDSLQREISKRAKGYITCTT